MNVMAEFESIVDELKYATGDLVSAGDVVLTLNVMKMLYSIETPRDGVITYCCAPGDYVTAGDVLASVE